MCFYLLPFLALSRREVEELPMPPGPARLSCPDWGLHSRAAPWQWCGWLDSESSLRDKTGLMWFLLQLLLRNKGLAARDAASSQLLPLTDPELL